MRLSVSTLLHPPSLCQLSASSPQVWPSPEVGVNKQQNPKVTRSPLCEGHPLTPMAAMAAVSLPASPSSHSYHDITAHHTQTRPHLLQAIPPRFRSSLCGLPYSRPFIPPCLVSPPSPPRSCTLPRMASQPPLRPGPGPGQPQVHGKLAVSRASGYSKATPSLGCWV